MACKISPGAGAPVIVKVGGSLFDLPGLGSRLRAWVDTLATPHLLVVPGGGATADAIRVLDRRHGLGEEAAHWLALRAMSLNAAVLEALMPASQVLEDWQDAPGLWRRGIVPILDILQFARADEKRPEHLPHHWGVTSDSLAARVAVVAQARELVLLKSVVIPEGMTWTDAAGCGLVDRFFPEVCAHADACVPVRAVNFRGLL